MPNPPESLRFLRPAPPAFGEPVTVAPGILWLRLPLPFALDHVNIYLLEEEGGWAIFDTGVNEPACLAALESGLAAALGGRPIVKMVVSHFHPDHAGLAGWLHQRFEAPLFMPQAEYLYSRLLQSVPARQRIEEPVFYQSLGLDADGINAILNTGKSYLQRVSGLPPSYNRLLDGGSVRIGGRDWKVLTGGGHAPEQAMLWCASDRIFLAADQVLARISPNVSVVELEPAANPLALYLESLARLQEDIAADALVLPGHNLAFHGLHTRLKQLETHHAQRCTLIVDACRTTALTSRDLVPVLFPGRSMDPHQLGFALGETLAHVNYLLDLGRLAVAADGKDTAKRYLAAA